MDMFVIEGIHNYQPKASQDQQNDQNEKQPQSKPNESSKEDAQRILENMENEEEKTGNIMPDYFCEKNAKIKRMHNLPREQYLKLIQ